MSETDKDRDEIKLGDILRANFTDRNSLIDSTLPTVAFLAGYLLSGSQLRPALLAAIGGGACIVVLRLVRRESLRHIAAGFLGVAFAAFLANQTGRAQDFFLPGLLLNLAYAAVFAVSAAIGKPLVGIGVQLMTDDGGAWREFQPLRRAVFLACWLWAGLFTLRVVVQVPLYLAGAIGPLGTAKLVLGFPLFLLGAFLTHRLLSPALVARREAEEQRSTDAGPSAGERPDADDHE